MRLSEGKPSSGRRLAGMDGLRALACVSVMTVHVWQIGPAGRSQLGAAWVYIEPIATIGLILFFTLSGFLLYRPFAAAIVGGRPLPSMRRYLRNRALRIVPAYWCALLLAAVTSTLAQPGNQNLGGGFDSVGTAVLNALLLQSYTPHTNLTGIPPAWSLSVEVVFYLVLPILAGAVALVLARRVRSRRIRLALLCAPPVALLFLGLAGKVVDHRLLGFSTSQATWGYVFQNSFLAKADLFSWGMVAAVITTSLGPAGLQRLPSRALAATGCALIVFADLGNQSPLAALGCGVIVLSVAAAFTRERPPWLARRLECRPVIFVGVASYSVYLLHWPVVLWLRGHGLAVPGWPGVFVNLASVAILTVGIASISYRFVELPAMRRKTRTQSGPLLARARDLTASRLQRSVAGSIAVSLLTQGGLLISGVAGARILSVLDRGRAALLLLFASVLPLLATLGMSLAVTYWVASNPGQTRNLLRQVRRPVIQQLLALTAVHAVVLVVVFADAPGPVQVSAAISLLASPAILLWIYGLAVLQGIQDFRALNLCRLIFPPLNAAFLIGLWLSGIGDLVLVTAIWVSLYLLSAVVTVAVACRRIARLPDTEPDALPANRQLAVFGAKALLGSASPLTQFQLDQTIVGLFISQVALGIYVVAVAFTNLPRFIAQSIGLVAYPHVAAARDGRQRDRATLRFVAVTVVLCGAVVAATELALPFLVQHLFGRQFGPAVDVARILLISAFMFSLTRVLSDCARGAGRPALGSLAELVALGSMLPFVLLLSASGVRGVAVALCLAAGAGTATIVVGMLVGRPRRGVLPTVAREAAIARETTPVGSES